MNSPSERRGERRVHESCQHERGWNRQVRAFTFLPYDEVECPERSIRQRRRM